jgi:CubicO group peptidase (beta-lactamase class C family)
MTGIIATDVTAHTLDRELLAALLDTLLPADTDRGMPGAADVGFETYMDTQGNDFVPALAAILESLESGFAQMTSDARTERVTAFAASDPAAFAGLLARVYDCYYQDDRVRVRIGVVTGAPYPQGHTLPAGDLSLLDPVIANADRHRYRNARIGSSTDARAAQRRGSTMNMSRDAQPFPISTPSEQGIDPAGIVAFLDALAAETHIEPHGLIIHRHGRRVVEGYWAPHDRTHRRLLYSLSKTFTGTALGLQIGEGRLGLDDLVSDHLPDAFAGAHPRFRNLRVRHIASMASGHDRETMQEALALDPSDPVRGFLKIPPAAEPGALFAYNQPPVIALATILQKQAGQRLVDYLRPRLFDPIGIGDVRWKQLKPGLDAGFTGVFTNLDAIARLGQLYLDDGSWNGRRVLPEGWVKQASAVQVANPERLEPDWQQGYGFQLWRSRHGYRGDGAYGQFMIVLPELDAMIAMVSCEVDMQRVLDLMWTHLLPAMQSNALRAGQAEQTLAERIASLRMPTARERRGGNAPSPVAGRYTPGPRDANSQPSVSSIEIEGNRMTVHEGDRSLAVSLTDAWTTSATDPVAASATSLEDGSFVVDLAMLETAHRLRITLHPASRTFETRWRVVPLFGASVDPYLGAMRAPD